jgi:hypothetical protein
MAYTTVADVRLAGVPAEFTDQQITAAIAIWGAAFERVCRQWFEPRPYDATFDGTDSDALHLDVPIITCSALYINDAPEPLDPSYYRVYSDASGMKDDRRNPRIKLRQMDDFTDIFTAPLMAGQLRFRKGRQNQRIVGTFGFVEADGSTPPLIKYALEQLIVTKLMRPGPALPDGVEPPPVLTGSYILEEETDAHRIKYGESFNRYALRRANGAQDLIDNPEVLSILKMYRAPIAMSTPANPSWPR